MSILDFVANHSGALFALLTTGAFAGLLAGLLGVGGGIIIVPVLFFLFQSNDVSPASAMVIATATSLATIVPTSISSIRAHYKKGNVDCPLLVRWGPFILLGVLLGSWLVTWINGTARRIFSSPRCPFNFCRKMAGNFAHQIADRMIRLRGDEP